MARHQREGPQADIAAPLPGAREIGVIVVPELPAGRAEVPPISGSVGCRRQAGFWISTENVAGAAAAWPRVPRARDNDFDERKGLP
jgi:hypothetical protein